MKLKDIRKIFLDALNKRLNRKHKKKWSPSRGWVPAGQDVFTVHVYSAVTGEKWNARVKNDSKRKFQNDMKAGSRIILDTLHLPINSSVRAFTEEEWKQYPILVELGKCKVPYVVHQARLMPMGKRLICMMFLNSIDNISYFQAIITRKALTSFKKPAILKRKPKPKRGKR